MAALDFDRLYAETMLKFDHILQAPGKQQPIKRQAVPEKNIEAEKQCELCRTSYPSRRLIGHHIVPEDVVQKAGLSSDRTIELCFSCHRALHSWNARNVSWVHRESETRRHRARALDEVVKEYDSAYSKFIEYDFKRSYNITYTTKQNPGVVGSLRPV